MTTTTESIPGAAAFPLRDRPWLHRFARRTARGARVRLEPEEVESLADLAAVRAWRRYDAGAGFAFTTYARWEVLGAVRRAIARRRRLQRPLPLGVVDAQRVWEPRAELALAARRALDALDEADRTLLVRHVVGEESLDALARELAVPRTTLWRRIQDAKARARRAVADIGRPRGC